MKLFLFTKRLNIQIHSQILNILIAKKQPKMLSQDQQQKLLGALLKKPENALCADCNSKSPCWASLDFGVFVCMNCSGAHRSLGQSITRIKSTKLDTWNRDWIWHMQLNNLIMNDYFQAGLNPIIHKKPNPNSSLNDIKKFVNDKYVRRLYAKQGQDDPITNLKNGKPPIKTSPISQTGKKQVPKKQTSQKQPQRSVNTPQVTLKPVKKIDNLLDDASHSSNRDPSQKNQKIREQINLFDDIKQMPSNRNNFLYPNQPTYNKQHFNSFSGSGAKHSSTGAVSFNDIFSTNQNNKNNNVNFDAFNTLITPNNPQHFVNVNTSHNTSGHYGHIHHHNLPHMHIHTTGVGTGYGINNQHHVFNQPPPTHVTMNINMNMYSNVMNINLNDNPSSTPATTNNQSSNLSDQIKLDINDFVVKPKKEPEVEKKKSWVDDWK